MKVHTNRVRRNDKKASFLNRIELNWIEKQKDGDIKLQKKTYDDDHPSINEDRRLMVKLKNRDNVLRSMAFDVAKFWWLYSDLTNQNNSNNLSEVPSPRYITSDTTTILGFLTLGK